MEKDNLAIISIAVALVALLIIISGISFAVFSSGRTASVENIIDPLASFGADTSQAGTTIIHIGNGGGSSDDDDDDDDDDNGDDPEIDLGSTIYIQEGNTATLNMDSYASDTEDSHSELEYDILSPTGNTIIDASLNDSTRVVTLIATGSAGQSVTLTIEVEDTDGNTDTDSVTVQITAGPSPNGPSISTLPDVYMIEDGTDYFPQSLNDYVTDPDNTDDEITWTVSGNTHVHVDIDPTTKNVTFTVDPNWNSDAPNSPEFITFRAEDPDGNYDTDVMMVRVTGIDDPAVWNALSDRTIDEDSNDGTVVYPNIVGQATDVDTPISMSVISSSSHYTLSIVGNDLVISNLEANWFGRETVTLSANGITNTFELNVRQLFDDFKQVCYNYGCEEWYE